MYVCMYTHYLYLMMNVLFSSNKLLTGLPNKVLELKIRSWQPFSLFFFSGQHPLICQRMNEVSTHSSVKLRFISRKR